MCVTAGEATTSTGSSAGIADAVEQPLARAEHDRDDVQVQLVEQAGGEVLVDRARAAGDRDVLVAGGRARLLERGLDPVGDEVERRAALHLERLARVVGEHVDRRVVRRVLAPPAAPLSVPRPGAGPNMLRPMT